MQTKIESLLKSTDRDGIDKLLMWMQDNGFYKSPCSSNHHLAKIGGLAEHSLNVWEYAHKIAREILDTKEYVEMAQSITLCALLHDLGKAGDYGKANYVDNILANGKQSTAKPYETNKDLMYIPHEIRSIKIASRYIALTEDEEWAILMHNGLYGNFKYEIQGKETKLYLIIHYADMWASRVIEA